MTLFISSNEFLSFSKEKTFENGFVVGHGGYEVGRLLATVGNMAKNLPKA